MCMSTLSPILLRRLSPFLPSLAGNLPSSNEDTHSWAQARLDARLEES